MIMNDNRIFAIPAKTESKSEKRDKYLDLARELNNYGILSDGDTNCN